MRIPVLFLFQSLLFCCCFAQPPAGYYNAASGLSGASLQQALHSIITNHTIIPYANLYTAFDSTDIKSNGQVWDIYSDNPSGTPPYVYYNNSTYQCGNYNSEGDCFNREHSWPQSWFNGTSPAYSDLFHLYPTDGWVNNKRANYPYGEVANASWTSMNGSKLGPNTTVGYSLTVFEPIDAYKGDLARGYFYMATRYLGEDGTWSTSDATNKALILPWELCVLINWHHQDPVSTKEMNRCNAIYKLQNNRNPYIDHPEWVDSVFSCVFAGVQEYAMRVLDVYPNPAKQKFTVTVPSAGKLILIDALGVQRFGQEVSSAGTFEVNTAEFVPGVYSVVFRAEKSISAGRVILSD